MFKNISVRTTEIELKTTNEEDGATWNTQTNCNNGNNNASPPIEAMRRDVGTPLQDKKNCCIIAVIHHHLFFCLLFPSSSFFTAATTTTTHSPDIS